MRNLDITKLRSFVAVADAGGVTRAAGFLHLTQSAVSQHVRSLESFLGRDLFIRRTRALHLTEAGSNHLPVVRAAFDVLSKTWGTFSIDAFASDSNKRVKRFFSRLYSEVAEGMDAFAQDWDGEHLWICPPVSLVGHAIKMLVHYTNASVVFCVLRWERAAFPSLLFPYRTHFANFFKNFVLFAPKYYSGQTVKSKMYEECQNGIL